MTPDFEDIGSDFATLFENSLQKKMLVNLKVGDKVTGKITKITANSVFVDISSRDDAVIDIVEFLNAEGECSVSVGDEITAFCVNTHHGITLSTKLNGQFDSDGLADAFATGLPVEGKVISERKGGYEVTLGNTTAFCPYSQMGVIKQEPATYIGNTYLFLIQEYSENGRNVVVSHRKVVEREMAEKVKVLRDTLQEGDVVEGTVTRVMPFGVFVDIGGVEGLIHISELSWSRLKTAEGLLNVGDKVSVKIKSLNWDENRIGLSLRSVQSDPWVTEIYKYSNGAKVKGTITRIAPFGLFVELEPGIEGLVHVSKLGLDHHVEDLSTEFKTGDEIEAYIEMVNVADRKISLTMNKKASDKDLVVNINKDEATDPELLKQIKGENRFGSANDIFGNIKL